MRYAMTTALDRDTPCSKKRIRNSIQTDEEEEDKKRRKTHLLTVDEDVDTSPETFVDPADGSLKMRLEVGGGAVKDVEPITLHLSGPVGIDGGEPRGIEDLDKGADGVSSEEGGVKDGLEGAEVECASAVGVGGREDEVHGCAHRLHYLGRDVVEADHSSRRLLLLLLLVVGGGGGR
jgi:hypothetical protein